MDVVPMKYRQGEKSYEIEGGTAIIGLMEKNWNSQQQFRSIYVALPQLL